MRTVRAAKQSQHAKGMSLPRTYLVALIAVLIAAILLPAYRLFEIRSRLDTNLWLWGALLIGAIVAVSIPLARWRHNSKKTSLSVPWPASENPNYGAPVDASNISLSGSFKWTRASFGRITKAWLQHTPAGRSHRKTMFLLTIVGLASAGMALAFLLQGETTAWILLVSNALLLAFTYSCRIRPFEQVLSQTEVKWRLTDGQLVMVADGEECVIDLPSACAMVRTPAGFIIWPGNPVEILLPLDAFADSEHVETFSKIVRSLVRNYTHAS